MTGRRVPAARGGRTAEKGGTAPEIEAYLGRLERRLFLVSHRIRTDILAEVRAHLEEGAAARGGGRGGALRAIRDFGPPGALAREYVRVYEAGPPVYALFSVLAVALALLSHPFLGPLSTGAFAILALCLSLTGLVAGRRVGLASAISAVAARLVLTAVFLLMYTDYVEYAPGAAAMFVLATLLLIPLGYIPGRLKERLFREDLV